MAPYIHIVIPSYLAFAVIGLCAAFVFVYLRSDKYYIEFGELIKLLIVSVLGIVIGGRLLFFVTMVPELFADFSIGKMIDYIFGGGYVFYGGLLGLLLLVYIVSEPAKRKDYFKLLAPAIPLFHCFGRIGCFMAGCCYGSQLAAPIELFGIVIDRIPVQLFEALFEASLFVILIILEKKSTKINLLRVYLVLYAVFRFCIEFFRGDEIRGSLLLLSTSQWISVLILIFIVIFKTKQEKLSV